MPAPRDASGPAHDRLETAARPFGWVAAVALIFMMLVTAADVVMRELYRLFDWLAGPRFAEAFNVNLGAVDLMELGLAVCVMLALPGVLLRDEHVTVDLIDSLGFRGLTFVLRVAALVLTFLFLTLALWQFFIVVQDKYTFNELSNVLEIDRFYYTIPILAGLIASPVAVIAVLIQIARRGRAGALERTKARD